MSSGREVEEEGESQCFVNRGRQGVVAASTFTMLRDATVSGLYQIPEAEEIDYDLRKADGELTFVERRTHASDALGYVIWELYGQARRSG